MATLTRSADGNGIGCAFSRFARDGRIKTICAPLSMSTVTWKGSVMSFSVHFQRKCGHFSTGDGLTDDKLLSSLFECSGRNAATMSSGTRALSSSEESALTTAATGAVRDEGLDAFARSAS